VGYESGEYEIVSIFSSAEINYNTIQTFIALDKVKHLLSVLDPLCCYVMSAMLSDLCLAWRGLWREGDAPAEVPALGERDPGTHSGGGYHPGELTARHTHELERSSPFPTGLGQGWHTLMTQPLAICLHTD